MSRAATPSKPRQRLSAEERRPLVIAAAITEFSEHGYEGTSTEAIASRAGVSQPYLFQLFGSKKDLFIAATREVFARTWQLFDKAASDARATDPSPEGILYAMGESYCALLRDRELLRCQMHAYSACADDEIRAAVRKQYSDLYWRVASISGADPETLENWFARGMLLNTIAAIAPDLVDKGEDIILAQLGPVEGKPPLPTRTKPH